MADAVDHLRSNGREINDEHLARLSPLQHEHVLMLGAFRFTLPHELAAGRRRQLRIGDGSAQRAFLFLHTGRPTAALLKTRPAVDYSFWVDPGCPP